MAVQNTSIDEPPDDATVVGVNALNHPRADDLTLDSHAAANATAERDEDAKVLKDEREEKVVVEPSPHGLTDQTNFLPTRQVIMVFCGLSVALACSFLDQTMYVPFRYAPRRYGSVLKRSSLVLPPLCLGFLPTCMVAPTAHGSRLLICSLG